MCLAGIGNVCRDDSPHPDHNPCHKVHRFDVRAGDVECRIEEIGDEAWPTVGEVIDEAEKWYYANLNSRPTKTDKRRPELERLLCKLLLYKDLVVVGATGFEPATSCSRSRRSTGLSYAPKPRGPRSCHDPF